jgi:hypothetical protein
MVERERLTDPPLAHDLKAYRVSQRKKLIAIPFQPPCNRALFELRAAVYDFVRWRAYLTQECQRCVRSGAAQQERVGFRENEVCGDYTNTSRHALLQRRHGPRVIGMRCPSQWIPRARIDEELSRHASDVSASQLRPP